MKDVSSANFGLLIAYLIPGFTAVWGLGYFSPTVRSWLNTSPADAPLVDGFLYVTLAAVAAGMVINAFRWLTLDQLHHVTGIPYPDWDFSRLQQDLGAYALLVDFYYRYHEFFGNMLVAGSFSYGAWRFHHPGWSGAVWDVSYVGLAALLWISSRDTLRKYYARTEVLLKRPNLPRAKQEATQSSASDRAA